ncbi:PREDICTED: uncharacterized protein LOC108773284, partial [Cyphomyrmex costatus]|uniref:uncharacterized protein LOC108773284 n=1 Tax=Cyphomyrmex costatus TaxID=456900 RepID=UPI00085239A8
MEELLSQQRLAMRSVTRALENFKKIGRANHTYGIVRNRLQTLKETYARCELLHAQLFKVATKEQKDTEKYFKEDVYIELEDAYLAASDYISDALASLEADQAPSSPGLSVSQSQKSEKTLTLPRINLPKFSGDLREWETFRDQFRSMIIDHAELSNVTRLQYLYSCLKDEARDALRNLPLTEANFKIAWNVLLARYDDKRRLVSEHIHTLHTLPAVNTDSAQDLMSLRDKANMSIQALKNLGRPVEWWDDLLVYLVVQKLNKATRKAWELHLGDKTEYPSYTDLHNFLASRIRAFENIPTTSTVKTKPSKSSVQSHTTTATGAHCPLCKQDHLLSVCPDFKKKQVNERRDLIVKFKRCLNCLSARHFANTCPSKHNCRQCQQRHHTMLHEATTSSATENSLESNETNTSNENNVVSHLITKTTFDKSRVLLATARIQVCSSSGRTDVIRALLDQGSVTSLISENLAQRLRLSRTRVAVSVTGIGETQSVARHAALISVSSKTGKGPSYSTTAIIMRSLTKYTPPKIAYQISLAHLSGLPWADPQPSSADPIEMIIGADLYGAVLLPGLCSGSSNQPTAQNSIFGWIMSGPISTSSSSNMSNVTVNHTTLHDNLDDEIRQFWEVEELPQVSYLTPEEQRCEEHFRATHSRDSNGRYVVRLPFKANPPIAIGESRHIASSLLSRLEGRLQNKRDIASEYREFLLEYENLGHMKKVDEPVSASQSVYIPHHAVIREHSSTTRLRVVFNASQSTSNGSSLNDHLMIGPKLQTDLRSVILRWRQHRYVFTADIAKMYRQIQVDPRDQDYQRILWRSSSSEAVQDYRLLTVTYGMACAPYLALRTIQQLTQDEGAQFPLAQSVLRNQIYVDDCIFGADDKPLARQIRNQLISLLQKGGFLLRKWASNCPTLLNDLPVNEKSLSQGKILQSDESFKVLGVTWLPATDTFQFSVEVTTSIPDSKRKILSTIAKLFDPLGWLAPVIITAKIIMQQLWATKCSWDDPIPPPLMQKWHNYHTQLIQLRNISLPRWTAFGSDTSHCELHGFADASSVAYAAVIYLKVISLMGSVTVSLLIAKSKVAPLKPLTIPRLELCAAALLARTMSFARTTLELSTIPCHCWTDSTVTLAWLRQSPSRWKTFVAHRVNDVQTLIPDAKWHHVPTHQNPADLASRGVTASSFAESSLWWQGPEWLKLPS